MILSIKSHKQPTESEPVIFDIYKANKMLKHIISFLCVWIVLRCEMLLNGVPFSFELAGDVSYTPSSGGVAIPGYIMKAGFNKHQWIGVKFMDLTSYDNFDVLVFQRSTAQTGGFYECTVSDFYLASGRLTTLMPDTINNMDRQVTSFSASNSFDLQIYRTKGNTQGEDWQGSEFSEICFFTSDLNFDRLSWSAQYEVCYGFSISSYVSTWVGYELKSDAQVDGVASKIYGGVSGPVLKVQMHIFRPNPTISSNEIVIRIGDKVSDRVGYDHHKCLLNKGDYFGNNTSEMEADLIYSGYSDNDCNVVISSTSLSLQFNRLLNTFDSFDNEITSDFKFCLIIGSSEDCFELSPATTFPQMTISSAIQLYEIRTQVTVGALLLLISLVTIF